ncbi:MAG TPA: hypothetical protein VGH19_10175 [Verrucomicrobiae bacterium]
MDLIHFILNAAAMLLWLSWRSYRFVPANDFRGGTLLSTLKKTERGQFNRKTLLTSLITLLGLRAIFYWHIGSGVDWAPRMDFIVLSIPFRCDYFDRMLLYSVLSFFAWVGVFYLWLITLQIINDRGADANPWHAIVKRHLGWLAVLPAWMRVLIPAVIAYVAWLILSKYFGYLRILPDARNATAWLTQGLVVSLSIYLLIKLLVYAVMALYILNSFVYLGNHAFLAYMNTTAQRMLKIVRWLPLRAGKFDFAPFLMIGLVFLLDFLLQRGFGAEQKYGLIWLFQQAS